MPKVPGSDSGPVGARRWAGIAVTTAAALSIFAGAASRACGTADLEVARGDTRVEHVASQTVLVNGGVQQTLPKAPRRIASLTVTGDEILTAVVDTTRLIAVSRFVDDPSISMCADRAPKAATRIRGMDPESIVALEPDVIFVAHYTLDYAVRLLTGAGIPVARFRNVHSYAEVEANVRLAAAATGAEERGEELIATMNDRLARVAARVSGRKPPRVLYYSPVNYTSGRGTLIDEKIRRAGGQNAAADFGLVGFDNVSLDVLLALNPDVIVVPRWSTDEEALHDLTANPAWKKVPALRDHRVYTIAASALTSEAPDGVMGVEELARRFFPEAFSS